jgi:hypothetical protein
MHLNIDRYRYLLYAYISAFYCGFHPPRYPLCSVVRMVVLWEWRLSTLNASPRGSATVPGSRSCLPTAWMTARDSSSRPSATTTQVTMDLDFFDVMSLSTEDPVLIMEYSLIVDPRSGFFSSQCIDSLVVVFGCSKVPITHHPLIIGRSFKQAVSTPLTSQCKTDQWINLRFDVHL